MVSPDFRGGGVVKQTVFMSRCGSKFVVQEAVGPPPLNVCLYRL